MIKKQVLSTIVLGALFGFETVGAMKSPYVMYPDIRGKDQYFLGSKAIPCKIYEVDFRFESEEGRPEKKIRVIQTLQSDKNLNMFMFERYGKYLDKWCPEFCDVGLESIGLTINGHKIAIKANMDPEQIVPKLAQLGTVTKKDSTIHLLRKKETKK